MESVDLELEVVGSVGSQGNVICVFTMADSGSLQGCHGPMIQRIQELAQVVCEKSVE